MSQKTEVFEDELGMYVVAGGYISRPYYGTQFQVGDKVKTHHFGGSTMAGVTVIDKPQTHNFRSNGKWERWWTTDMFYLDYKKAKSTLSQEEFLRLVKEKAEYFNVFDTFLKPIHVMDNKKFEK